MRSYRTVSALLSIALLPLFAPVAHGASSDPVIAKITSRINELPLIKVTGASAPITWVLSPKVPTGYKKNLLAQNQLLVDRFPTLYKWSGTTLLLIGDPFTWTPPQGTLSSDCERIYTMITSEWKALPNLSQRLLAGTSYCDGHMFVIIRPDPSNPVPDGDLMAQELGSEIQENARYLNPAIAGLDHGQLVIPDWYLQGAQSAIAYVVYIGQKRTIAGAPSKTIVTPDCLTVPLKKLETHEAAIPPTCLYTKGFASVQLMIALYGWDATTRWFSGFTDSRDYEGAFKRAYGDSLPTFNKLADSYWKSIVNKSYKPTDVIARLKK